MPTPPQHSMFKPGESGNPAGRPKKIFTVLKESGYTRDDIREAFTEIGWQTMDDLQEIFKNDKSPAIMRLIAHAFKRGVEKGDFRYVSEILQHVIGKPKEQSENKHLHKIIVEYVNPTGPTDTTTSGADGDFTEAEEV